MQTVITYYKNLTRWDIKYFVSNLYFSDNLIELREFLIPKAEKIKKDDYLGDLDVVEKITFNNGIIHFRKERATGMDLFKGRKGDLLTSKINIHQGAVAICPKDLVCSTHYHLYQINEDKINPAYLVLVLRSALFLRKIIKLKASSIKNEIGPKLFLDFKIYVPSMAKQKRIVDYWHNEQKKAQELMQKADEKEKAIDNYVLQELGIENKKYEKRKGAFVAWFSNLERWGINFNSYNWNLDNIFKSKQYKTISLSIVAIINKTYQFSEEDLKKEVSFVPMESVSDIEGKIITPQIKKLDDIKNGFTRFSEGDIIFAKITPCMENGKCAIAKNLTNSIGIGSTEFHVLSPKNDLVDTEYLWIFLRLKTFRKSAERFFTGSAGQQRVPANFLKEIKIPIPPLLKQKEITMTVKAIKREINDMRNKADIILETAKNKISKILAM